MFAPLLHTSLHTDIILNLKLLDRARPGEATWNFENYHALWETLQEEFELQQRFQNIDFKLELIQNNIKFFLEVNAHNKGFRLEWAIIVLISAELALGIYDHMDALTGLVTFTPPGV